MAVISSTTNMNVRTTSGERTESATSRSLELRRKLREISDRIAASGKKGLTLEQVRREVAERRG